MYGATGLTFTSANVTSQGNPLSLNLFAPSAVVQEQPVSALTTLIGGGSSKFAWSSLNLRFTDLPVLGGAVTYFYVNDLGSTFVVPGPLTMRDCQLLGGQLSVQLGTVASSGMTLNVTNNLFERCSVSIGRGGNSLTPKPTTLVLNLYNNLFHYGSFAESYSVSSTDTTNTLYPWYTFNNLFENVTLFVQGMNSGTLHWSTYLTDGHNGYVNVSTITNSAGGDVSKTVADYQAGLLGAYYYPTTGTNLNLMINAGSTNADVLGLYYYTTTTNQTLETNYLVDIGFHYWAVVAYPIFAQQPTGVALFPGGTATFSVAPSTYYWWLPISYQWVLNGTNIAGATNASLTVTKNIGQAQAGNYWVVASAPGGPSQNSGIATLELIDGCSKTYDVNADFQRGYTVNLNDTVVSNQLQLNQFTSPFGFVNASCSAWGTLVRIDANSGAVIGEYATAPNYTCTAAYRTQQERAYGHYRDHRQRQPRWIATAMFGWPITMTV